VKITTYEFAKLTGGRLHGLPDLVIGELLTDSRQFSVSDGLTFFAIKGTNHDGHSFIRNVYDRGVRIYVVQKLPNDADELKSASFIIVNDTITALQDLASWKRRQFRGRVIGITGSAGKTIVKEWLADILGTSRSVVRSPKSYNSQVGVPLSVWKLEDIYDTGIFEAGISLPGEMEKLERVIMPDIGIITNIGDAHSENFKDLQAKASEKLKLFVNSSAIVYCRDHTIIHDLIRNDINLSSRVLADWSYINDTARYKVRRNAAVQGKTVLILDWENGTMEFSIPFSDMASVENAVSVAVGCLMSGIEPEQIKKGMAALLPVAMRMEIKAGINGCILIEDYYNSDPGSLRMAIDYLQSQNSRKHVLILSDFIQSGRDPNDLYREVAGLVKRSGIMKFVGIGESIYGSRSLFPAGSRFYHSTEDYLHHINPSEFSDEIILLKGARIFEFEKIGQVLEQQVHQTVLEINLDAISHNLNEFKKHLSSGTRIMAMVKAFAYGAGPSEIASLLEYHGIDYLAVAYSDEGAELREAGVSAPIVVMNPEPSGFGQMIRYNLEPEIYSLSLLAKFADAASRHGISGYPVHIKIDTGMHRLGFMPEETGELIARLKISGALKVMSVFSHLAASEDKTYDDFTRKQAGKFIQVTEKLRKELGYNFLRHILNSAGISRFPEYQFDMVRPGIGLYGINIPGGLNLRPAGRYKTRISQIKRIPGGEPVGYGCNDVSESERTIAILPAGYADGIDRRLGNRNGRFFIKGHSVAVIGNICMDMCMADITGIEAHEGDEAEIFGENISVDEMASRCGTIPYEILTSIPSRVKRVFYRE
jgi:Alr-MurF fusion protein